MNTIDFEKTKSISPNYFMIPKDYKMRESFLKGFDISEFFLKYGMGVATGNDSEYISFNKEELKDKFENHELIQTIDYRLFDKRFIYNDYSLIERGREDLMYNMISQTNIGLISLKRARKHFTSKFGIVNSITDKSIVSTLDNGYLFPLYLYPNNSSTLLEDSTSERVPNLNMEIVSEIAKGLKFEFEPEKSNDSKKFAPIDLLDYIYAVLHSPTYREKYKEFLKIDFPRVPYPKDQETFWKLVKLGGEIRQIHLLESSVVEEYITQYPIDGDNVVSRKITMRSPGYVAETETHGKIYINDTQYFDNVPLVAWEFYIGGYQPAQKWLKNRIERQLDFEDILHYQKIIVALTETDRLMKEIDEVEIEKEE